jgi:hypothetical protein
MRSEYAIVHSVHTVNLWSFTRMNTPVHHWRATEEDRRRMERIKHCAGYLTDARAIRKALEHYAQHLEQSKKGSE